ncbi:MFS transporter, YQGE family, putative transporter [Paenibacillus sp. yr247]|uniref:MFS transporter n=1 Tax=Paenibacillus sp. yr247 TaxID=1761880 RepID=UPI00088D4150|nr:MFS transporter [Paenibacillus sp. yr247]SDN27824.1 MFS transporter, YQGE family, putative transporter [Paenibacillus sp. yr247]
MQKDLSRKRIQPGKAVGRSKSNYFEDRGNRSSDGKGLQKKSRLDAQAILLLIVHTLFGSANALSGTFVGVYLWKAKNDLALIGWFTLVTHLTMAITFWLAGKWVKEHNKMNCLRLGVAVSACFYMLVLLLGTSSFHYFVWLGMVQGISAGLFWIAFNVVYFEVTDPDNRDRFNGWVGLLGSGAGIVAPWISGLLIVSLGDGAGYRLIFSISLGIFLLGVIISFFLKKRKVQGAYEWLFPFRCLRQAETPWKRVSLALVFQGVREGVFGFMIALLVYISTSSEASLGKFVLITSAVSLVSFWAAGRFIKPHFRKISMLIGSVMVVAVIIPFFWKMGYSTLLIFGLGAALFFPMYSVPMVSAVFDLIGSNEASAKQREEYVVLRELSLNVGRVCGVLLFISVISWSKEPLVINVLLLIIGSSPLVSWYFMKNQLSVIKP